MTQTLPLATYLYTFNPTKHSASLHKRLAAHWSLYGESDRAGLRACPHCKSTAVDCTACPLSQVCTAKVCRRSAAMLLAPGGAAAGAGAGAPPRAAAETLRAAGRRLPGEPSGKGNR